MAKRLEHGETTPKKNKIAHMCLSPSRIVNMSEKADVEAVVRSVSPGEKFFDGELSEGEAIIRFYGFDKEKADRLKCLCDKQQPCLLRNCVIKQGRRDINSQ